jgi:uncharacterized protein (DUF433 family)
MLSGSLGKVSGQWVIRGTRIIADAVIANAKDGYTAEELPIDQARRVIDFARTQGAYVLSAA